MAIWQNRAELLMLEIQEERERLQTLIFFGVAAAVLGLLAGMTLTAVIALSAGEHYLGALIALTVVYAGVALVFFIKFTQIQRHWESLSATRDQLKKDRECLEQLL